MTQKNMLRPCPRSTRIGCEGCPFAALNVCEKSGFLPAGVAAPPIIPMRPEQVLEFVLTGIRLLQGKPCCDSAQKHELVELLVRAGIGYRNGDGKIHATPKAPRLLEPFAQAVKLAPAPDQRVLALQEKFTELGL